MERREMVQVEAKRLDPIWEKVVGFNAVIFPAMATILFLMGLVSGNAQANLAIISAVAFILAFIAVVVGLLAGMLDLLFLLLSGVFTGRPPHLELHPSSLTFLVMVGIPGIIYLITSPFLL